MTLRLLGTLLAALTAATSLLGATGGMALLPAGTTDGKATAATFALGLSVDGGNNWVSGATLRQPALIRGTVTPEGAHVGKIADVFVLEFFNGKFSMLTAPGSWEAWSGQIPALRPFQNDVVLGSSNLVTVLNGTVATAGVRRYYLGYQVAGSTAVIYSTTPASLEFTLPPDPLSYFESSVADSIVMNKCVLCHSAGGVAGGSGLSFLKVASRSRDNYDIFSTFYKSRARAYDYVLSKVSGGNGHLGGTQLAVGSSDYDTFATFLNLLEGSQVTSGTAQSLFDNIVSQSPQDTLRDAALLFAGRLPSQTELAYVAKQGDSGVKQVLLDLMRGPHFHEFLKDGANDRLLLRGNEDVNLADDCGTCFPALNTEYWRLKTAADEGSATDRAALTLLMNQLAFSVEEAPLELIAYVVENNKPYSEILTANYDMLTPVLNPLVGGTATFSTGATGVSEFKPGRITGYYLRNTGTVTQFVTGAVLPKLTTPPTMRIDYPHVGVLNSKAFLARFPTTATNRNRARSRWTYYNFLGIDIEALAQRTTDPVALADTNNPTMNNPACTVCHTVLDPLAGAFQDYSDNGIYRIALNGTDSLDAGYKAARNPALYKTGDTWYRDMRVPGFEGKTATGNSLAWLADQIVKDSRFASATVRFWWPAVMGRELLEAPEAKEDVDYLARLRAFEAQEKEIAALAARFAASGLSLKSLLADLALSPWYRAERQGAAKVSALTMEAQALAGLAGEVLLTPEQLGRKTNALTGFNWYAQIDANTAMERNGLETTYSLFYGGIDSFAITKRARELAPLMSNVAATHALEASCPIVLGDFIRADGARLLFGGLSPWVTPLTQQSATQSISSSSDTDFKPQTLELLLPAGTHNVTLSHLNDACDYSTSASTCRADKNLVVASVQIRAPNGSTTTLNGSTAKFGSCAAVTSTTRLTLYSSCTADYAFTAAAPGLYTITASLAAKQSATDPVLAGLNVETTTAGLATAGEEMLKRKLVELHGKLLGQSVTVTSPEVLASYDLLLKTWQSRKAGAASPSLLQRTLACDWSTDIGFVDTLGYPGSPTQNTAGRISYKTSEVTAWLTPRAQDPLYMKQSWVTVMAYLLSHYDYLHE
jgi:hypothetical protein